MILLGPGSGRRGDLAIGALAIRELFNPAGSSPREISSHSSFDVTLTPCAFEIMLPLSCVTFINAAFPIYKLKRDALLC